MLARGQRSLLNGVVFSNNLAGRNSVLKQAIINGGSPHLLSAAINLINYEKFSGKKNDERKERSIKATEGKFIMTQGELLNMIPSEEQKNWEKK